MASLQNQYIDQYYPDLLQVSNSAAGVDATTRDVSSGSGTASALQLSTTVVNVNGTFKINGYTITIPRTFTISGNYTFTGTLSANTSVTFPTSGTLITLTGSETLTNKTIAAPVLDGTITGTYTFGGTPTFSTPDLGTPSAGVLTNCTGLPISTGIDGLGTSVATFLATPSSANLRAALTDETGTGAAVFATSPTLVTPTLGVATVTSVNKMAITAPATSSTLAVADGKTATVSNTLTFDGTDASTVHCKTGGYVVYDSASSDAWTSFSPGWTGFSSNPTSTATYKKIGKTCFINVTTTVGGTSNATSFTMTGLPFTANTTANFKPVFVVNNTATTEVASGQVSAGTTTIVFYLSSNASGWTASGTKYVSFQCFYETT